LDAAFVGKVRFAEVNVWQTIYLTAAPAKLPRVIQRRFCKDRCQGNATSFFNSYQGDAIRLNRCQRDATKKKYRCQSDATFFVDVRCQVFFQSGPS